MEKIRTNCPALFGRITTSYLENPKFMDSKNYSSYLNEGKYYLAVNGLQYVPVLIVSVISLLLKINCITNDLVLTVDYDDANSALRTV